MAGHLPHMPNEILDLIFQEASHADATNPRLVIVTVAAPPSLLLQNNTLHEKNTLDNATHLRETRPQKGLLGATAGSRAIALATLAHHAAPSADLLWALAFLRIPPALAVHPPSDILFLRSATWPFNCASALAMVLGAAFPHIMLSAAAFARGFAGAGLAHAHDPVAHSEHHLLTTGDPAWTAWFDVTHPGGLRAPLAPPRTMSFLLGPEQPPPSACADPAHEPRCLHADHLVMIPAAHIADWRDVLTPAEKAQVAHIVRLFAAWAAAPSPPPLPERLCFARYVSCEADAGAMDASPFGIGELGPLPPSEPCAAGGEPLVEGFGEEPAFWDGLLTAGGEWQLDDDDGDYEFDADGDMQMEDVYF